MLINLAGFLLALMVAAHIVVVIAIYRQRISSFFIPLYIYLNLMLLVIELCSLFFLQDNVEQILPTIFKIRLIAQSFIPPILISLSQNYSSNTAIPKFNSRNLLFFGVSILISIMGITGHMINGISIKNGISYLHYGEYYWILILYFYFTLAYLFIDFAKHNQTRSEETELNQIRRLLLIYIPITLILFSIIHLAPYFSFIHPIMFLIYPLLSLMLIFLAFKFNLLEMNDINRNYISFFLISFIFVLLFTPFSSPNRGLLYLLIIPAILFISILYQIILSFILKLFNRQNFSDNYSLEEELEVLSTEVWKYIDDQALAQFLGAFAQKVLKCTKCAVIIPRFDIRPFQVMYLKGFSKQLIEGLLSDSNSLLIEKLELEQKVVNKYTLSPLSNLYQVLEKYQLDLGIPLISQNKLSGFIFLGGGRKITRFLKRDLEFIRLLSINAANAFQNILTIQNAVQTQKMADLGIVASQLAHDFQSFITLVKLETPEETQLKQHADYMEKLVRDLLNYAKPKDLRLSLVNINELIDMTLDLVNLPEKITLERHYSNSIPQINIDIDQMRRVFMNLFENSINAMKGNRGRLKITTRPLRPLSTMRRNTWIYIEILDDGKGIPDDLLERIFDPFFTTRKSEGGNGMGLAIVKQIITRHKGFIDVTSKPNKGTIFNIRLPYII